MAGRPSWSNLSALQVRPVVLEDGTRGDSRVSRAKAWSIGLVLSGRLKLAGIQHARRPQQEDVTWLRTRTSSNPGRGCFIPATWSEKSLYCTLWARKAPLLKTAPLPALGCSRPPSARQRRRQYCCAEAGRGCPLPRSVVATDWCRPARCCCFSTVRWAPNLFGTPCSSLVSGPPEPCRVHVPTVVWRKAVTGSAAQLSKLEPTHCFSREAPITKLGSCYLDCSSYCAQSQGMLRLTRNDTQRCSNTHVTLTHDSNSHHHTHQWQCLCLCISVSTHQRSGQPWRPRAAAYKKHMQPLVLTCCMACYAAGAVYAARPVMQTHHLKHLPCTQHTHTCRRAPEYIPASCLQQVSRWTHVLLAGCSGALWTWAGQRTSVPA